MGKPWKPYLKFRKLSLCFAVEEKVQVDPVSWRLREIEEGVAVLEGRKVGESRVRVYTYRFDKSKFNYLRAKAYLDERKIVELRKPDALITEITNALLPK